MVIWVLRDGGDLLSGTGERVPVDRVSSYADICDLHICEFTNESEALEEAEALDRGSGQKWLPEPLDLADLNAEDLVEHFED